MKYKIKKISGDASSREFYRVYKNFNSSILVVAKKEKYKNLIVYSLVNKILNKNKVLAPRLINNFNIRSIIEISDLGNNTFFNFIKNKKNKFKYYKKLIDLIIVIQKIKLNTNYSYKGYKIKFQKYNSKNLHRESDLFFEWYLKPLVSNKKFNIFKDRIRKELDNLYKQLYFKNKFFTHRDFHVSNIMISKKKLGLIDNQDAIIGNPLYDVASLIDDVRIKISKIDQNKLFKYYILKSKILNNEKKYIKNDYDILSVQRNFKILGIFVRLFKRDNKPGYLRYIKNTWRLIDMRTQNPIFKNLNIVMKKNLSLKKIKKAKFI